MEGVEEGVDDGVADTTGEPGGGSGLVLGSWLNSDSEDTSAKGFIHMDSSEQGNLMCLVGSSTKPEEATDEKKEPLECVQICTFCLGVGRGVGISLSVT